LTADSIVERARPTDPVRVPPLTRNGYTRTDRAEHDIQELWHVSGEAVVAAFDGPGDEVAGGRSTEALVFFVRRAALTGERRIAEALFGHLVERVNVRLRGAIRGIDQDGRADIQAEILADITRLILSADDSGDFLQSRFWLYLRRRTITARAAWLKAKSEMLLEGDSRVVDDEGDFQEQRGLASNDLSPEDAAILADALERLPPELRELVVLRHYEGWRVGDEAPEQRSNSDPTLAERYGITPRAVRKRLVRAAAILNQNPKDQI
jgi:DNA-directed RNA polymerase specialized sigma24 family protein